MKLIGLMPVRNEDWILGLSARVALSWCDALVILLHCCEDESEEIAAEVSGEHPGRVVVLGQQGEWDEMAHRQRILNAARKMGATHVAIIDADEVLTANLVMLIRFHVITLNRDQILQVPLYNLRGSARYHSNGIWGNRIVSLALADSPAVAWSGDKFHSREPLQNAATYKPYGQDSGGVLHFWGASERRLIAKHALYKVTERLRYPMKQVEEIDAIYNWAIKGRLDDTPVRWTCNEVKREWVEPYRDLIDRHLRIDAAPWQEQAVRDAVREHGREKFRGLDLFGLA